MLNIRELIDLRSNYALQKLKVDEWIDEINNTDTQEELFVIVPESFLHVSHNKQLNTFKERYTINGIYELGNLYANTATRFVLVRTATKPVSKVDVGIFAGNSYNKRERPKKMGTLEIPSSYSSEFETYVQNLENWINNGIIPVQDKKGQCEYNTILKEATNYQKLYPNYYSKQAIDVRTALTKEKTVELSTLVDIVVPRELKDEEKTVKRLRASDLSYPLKIDDIQGGRPTTVVLSKGDIVVSTAGTIKPFLFNVDTNSDIYASPHMAIIKCKSILPEYLYLYLMSDTMIHIMNSNSIGTGIRRLTIKDLASLPVILPKLDDTKYRLDFYALSSIEKRSYQINLLSGDSYNKPEIGDDDEEKRVEDILNIELATKIKIHNEEALRQFLTDDLKELNTCFKGKFIKLLLYLLALFLKQF